MYRILYILKYLVIIFSNAVYFQEALKRLRVDDDKIIYQLNEIIPTPSFSGKVNTTEQCKSLYERMMRTYDGREKAIQHCVIKAREEVEHWRKCRLENRDDVEAENMLRKSQHKLRLMQRELDIDKVVKDRSYKIFYERCRNAYTPPHRPVV
ncbi:protein MIX23-like [Ruditapes philippinarum]|uniref:protein MIX23-like n=1 Tax=Ruditapes philippinarum TaxID=129788 RepID=UPI00295B9696|nr:protein MIX23-like [Ruditapes philippinarum]